MRSAAGRAVDELNICDASQIERFREIPATCRSGKVAADKSRKTLMKQFIILLLYGFTLTIALAEEPDSRRIQGIESNGSDCISVRTIRDYTALDEQNLLIRGAGKRTYLVTLQHRTFELRSSFGLGFTTRDDRLCPYGGDSIVFNGLSRESVGIRAITEVSREQAEQLMIHFGKKQPDEQQTAAPKPVKGAEVEELD